MERIYPQFFIALLFLIIIAIGCEDTITGTDIDKVVIPDSDVSYSQYIQPVFNVKCSISGCHDDGTRSGDYSLTNWSNAVMPGVINASNVETSRLVWRIEGLGGDYMPPIRSNVAPLTKNQVKGIKTWIKEGALSN